MRFCCCDQRLLLPGTRADRLVNASAVGNIYYINFENNGECHYRMFNIIDGELTEDELDGEKEHSEMLNNLYHLEREKEKSTDD